MNKNQIKIYIPKELRATATKVKWAELFAQLPDDTLFEEFIENYITKGLSMFVKSATFMEVPKYQMCETITVEEKDNKWVIDLTPVQKDPVIGGPLSTKMLTEAGVNVSGDSVVPAKDDVLKQRYCYHNWVKYDGIFETWDYCKDCGVKR